MKNYKLFIALLFLLSFTNKGFAQYAGGKGSGFAMAETAQSSLGIKPIKNEIGFRFSPNPAKAGQIINLQFEKGLNANTTLIVMDLSGKVFQTETIVTGTIQYQLNTSGIKPGVYVIKIGSQEYEMEKKLILL